MELSEHTMKFKNFVSKIKKMHNISRSQTIVKLKRNEHPKISWVKISGLKTELRIAKDTRFDLLAKSNRKTYACYVISYSFFY